MKQGDFTKLAKEYTHRTGYSEIILKMLASYIGAFREGFKVADVGAGSGKLTEHLCNMGFEGYAIEPNDAMREEGMQATSEYTNIQWRMGSGEETGLPENCVNWVFMASSFHWTDPDISLKEFFRILRSGGYFTALWNPRNLENNELHQRIESLIYDIAPEIERVSSGSSKHTKGLEETLISTGHFQNVIFTEIAYEIPMEKERYLGAWRSVNDIQAQAGKERFEKIMRAIENEISDMKKVIVPYKTRAWTVQAKVD